MFKAIPIILGMILTAPCQYPKDVIVQEYNNGLVSVVDDNGDVWQFWGGGMILSQDNGFKLFSTITGLLTRMTMPL